jgi:hypothetical protein
MCVVVLPPSSRQAVDSFARSPRRIAVTPYARSYPEPNGPFGAVLILCWVLGLTEHAAAVFLLIAAAGTTLAVWQGVEQVRHGGITESADGIANRTTLGYRRWRWDEIEEFKHVGSRVYLVTRDWKASQLAGVNEGWRNIWEDGETRAITALLNQRLKYWRSGDAV